MFIKIVTELSLSREKVGVFIKLVTELSFLMRQGGGVRYASHSGDSSFHPLQYISAILDFSSPASI